jgi:hypothetical protein
VGAFILIYSIFFFSEIIKTRKHDHKDRAAAFFRQDYEEKKQTLNDEEKKHILEYNYGCFLKYFLFKNILK